MCISNSGGCEVGGARLFSVLFSGRTRYNGHKIKFRELYLNTNPIFFSCEDGQTVKVFQRSGFSVLGDTHNLTELGPEQSAVAYPALGVGAELTYL